MRLEKANQRGKQDGIAGLAPQFIRPDSGQIQEAPRPTFVAERCRKCGEGQRDRVIWCLDRHRLETAADR